MKTDELITAISDHLQEVNDDTKERLKRIDEMLFFLNFNRRLTELSDEEKEDFVYSNEGYPWTDDMRKAYDTATDDITKQQYLEMWSRSTYMRQCDWNSYLTGQTEEKPILQKHLKIA